MLQVRWAALVLLVLGELRGLPAEGVAEEWAGAFVGALWRQGDSSPFYRLFSISGS